MSKTRFQLLSLLVLGMITALGINSTAFAADPWNGFYPQGRWEMSRTTELTLVLRAQNGVAVATKRISLERFDEVCRRTGLEAMDLASRTMHFSRVVDISYEQQNHTVQIHGEGITADPFHLVTRRQNAQTHYLSGTESTTDWKSIKPECGNQCRYRVERDIFLRFTSSDRFNVRLLSTLNFQVNLRDRVTREVVRDLITQTIVSSGSNLGDGTALADEIQDFFRGAGEIVGEHAPIPNMPAFKLEISLRLSGHRLGR